MFPLRDVRIWIYGYGKKLADIQKCYRLVQSQWYAVFDFMFCRLYLFPKGRMLYLHSSRCLRLPHRSWWSEGVKSTLVTPWMIEIYPHFLKWLVICVEYFVPPVGGTIRPYRDKTLDLLLIRDIPSVIVGSFKCQPLYSAFLVAALLAIAEL